MFRIKFLRNYGDFDEGDVTVAPGYLARRLCTTGIAAEVSRRPRSLTFEDEASAIPSEVLEAVAASRDQPLDLPVGGPPPAETGADGIVPSMAIVDDLDLSGRPAEPGAAEVETPAPDPPAEPAAAEVEPAQTGEPNAPIADAGNGGAGEARNESDGRPKPRRNSKRRSRRGTRKPSAEPRGSSR